MSLSRTSIAVGCALLTYGLVATAGCGGDPAPRQRDAGESGAGGAGSGGQGGSGGLDAGGDAALDGGLLDAASSDDAAVPLPAPAGFTISSGGGRGSSAQFTVQVGIGTPIPVTQGAGQSHRLALGSPVLVQGSQRR